MIQKVSLGVHYHTEAGEIDLPIYLKDASMFDIKDGYVAALEGLGLGIEVNEELVRRISKKTEP